MQKSFNFNALAIGLFPLHRAIELFFTAYMHIMNSFASWIGICVCNYTILIYKHILMSNFLSGFFFVFFVFNCSQINAKMVCTENCKLP